jgi:hypothetical protein
MKKLCAALLFLSLAGCAGIGGGSQLPVSIVSDISNTTGTHVAVMLPLGNEALDNGGMDYIAALAAKIPGVTRVQIYDYYQTAAAANDIAADPPGVKEIVIGFSCGANASPDVAAGVTRPIAGVFVIQRSQWCGGDDLSANVLRAQETYNPNCLDTAGLGCAPLIPGPGFNSSNLTFIERPDCHICSDHDPDAVNDIISAIRSVTNESASRKMAAARGTRVPGSPHVLIRYHGQSIY